MIEKRSESMRETSEGEEDDGNSKEIRVISTRPR
jgi:hypothetical protein